MENGYIDAIASKDDMTTYYIFENLTLQGGELLNLFRNNTVGKKITKFLKEQGLQAFPILIEITC